MAGHSLANILRWYVRVLSVLPMPYVWLNCVANSCRKRFRKALAACLLLSVWTMPLSLKRAKSLPKAVVSPVNFNSPGQVVIAGHKEAVERAGVACKAAGAKRALPLPVSVPSHCALMKPAAEKLAVELQKITFNAPTVPVVNNVDVKCETTADAIRDALVRQLYSPVQWTKTVEFMASGRRAPV